MIELTDDDGLRAAAEDDPLVVWAARGFTTGARAWTHGGATAVASPALSGRDRLAVRGPVADAAPLVRHALAEAGPGYRPFGDAALVRALCEELEELELLGGFGWMDTKGPALGPSEAHWLGEPDLDEVSELLDAHFPDTFAHPRRPGADAWAGVRDERGRLTAVAADAWSAPSVGLLAGVAAHPEHGRGRGHAEAACRLVLDTQLGRCGRAALLVKPDNLPAIRLYERLGLSWRGLDSARKV